MWSVGKVRAVYDRRQCLFTVHGPASTALVGQDCEVKGTPTDVEKNVLMVLASCFTKIKIRGLVYMITWRADGFDATVRDADGHEYVYTFARTLKRYLVLRLSDTNQYIPIERVEFPIAHPLIRLGLESRRTARRCYMEDVSAIMSRLLPRKAVETISSFVAFENERSFKVADMTWLP